MVLRETINLETVRSTRDGKVGVETSRIERTTMERNNKLAYTRQRPVIGSWRSHVRATPDVKVSIGQDARYALPLRLVTTISVRAVRKWTSRTGSRGILGFEDRR